MELLRSSGGEAEAGGLAGMCDDSNRGLQGSAQWCWDGRGEGEGEARGPCAGTGSAGASPTQGSQSGGLPRPPPVLCLSLGESLLSSSEESVNLETLATGDTEADEPSVGLQRPRSWASRAPVRSLPPPEKPLIQAVVGPGNRVGWAPGRVCTIWIPPMGIRGHGARGKCWECRGRWLKMFSSVRAGMWPWKS